MNDTAAAILKATAALRDGTEKLRFESPVHVTYNPLTYAWGPHEQYVRTYGNGEKGHLFLGMNPGPFGMAQTGVPFGEVDAVVNWLHIRGEVGRPEHTHPKRPVEGFGCPGRKSAAAASGDFSRKLSALRQTSSVTITWPITVR